MPTPLVVIPGDVDQARGYRIGKWRTFKNYCCLYCQFKTLWIEKMEKHQLEDVHVWAFPGQNPPTPGEVRKSKEPEY